MQNHLKNETSPYLLQHSENPVNWYPWCEEAFAQAKKEDKPIFLSIGYSTCHWCHVMAHESFEDEEIARILNQYFVAIKVDKEERPDIDSIYMSVCQAFTGSGGWPTTIFLTPEQKPFFAGTYFPKTIQNGQIGLKELLLAIHEKWRENKEGILESAEELLDYLKTNITSGNPDFSKNSQEKESEEYLIHKGVEQFKAMYDPRYGGFGEAPKFPVPYNLLFLMRYYERGNNKVFLEMVEKTLLQMYRGGIFDHIGGGFCRYSTDAYFLVPHFEKMLYDNALLILTYSKAYQITGNELYRHVAEKTAKYILREMTSPERGFYSAQDADCEGEEGKYYLFTNSEIEGLLGEQVGRKFNQYFGMTEAGNFEGKNIPNLLHDPLMGEVIHSYMTAVYEYRKKRYPLHLDDKILTSWNGLMIAAMCALYRVTGKKKYLHAAVDAQIFIWDKLREKETLYVSYRKEKRGQKGFLDDYAFEIFALLSLYEAALDPIYLEQAKALCEKVITDFEDKDQGGFFLYGKENEQLVLRPKETYDGAVFSGNSAMAYNLVQMFLITGEPKWKEKAEKQLAFFKKEAAQFPASHSMFLIALLDHMEQPDKITIVKKEKELPEDLSCEIPLHTTIHILEEETKAYPLKKDRTTYYICQGKSCKPPTNELVF